MYTDPNIADLEVRPERLGFSQVVGAPIAGFYFFANPYTGPDHTDPAAGLSDFRETAWSSYWALWEVRIVCDGPDNTDPVAELCKSPGLIGLLRVYFIGALLIKRQQR
jgi:hypothetical protein